ncbi:Gfo/Idh/MocA family protein [Altererythrobacter sp. C41]|uniref:Gfo/Idh/MocA family protein n=1 Tax=Altererythrobacter sp. C41 TaxID=2806021 RepID=UPI0019315F44|nr:Gfo/Idh/MocA family oxidoreductase [Altererythrobacter sp. C41]MBM0171214.1 Gfo/Idh/MocA family oxidoreductase [Altererythrobacter sp. C41]
MQHDGHGATPIRLALVGIGKIAQDQHIPALQSDKSFELVAAVSRSGGIENLPCFTDIGDLLESGLDVDAVSLATPPQGRHAIAGAALDAGLHVMLEKPPAATVSEVADLAARARAAGVTLFTTWHSREAASVDAARDWLAGKTLRSARIDWREDIRVWHPGQEWILQPGGLGVFDPGINALSIVTAILADPLLLQSARLEFPANRQAPIAAQLSLRSGEAAAEAAFDFLQTGPQSWDIVLETDSGRLVLSDGGQRLAIDGAEISAGTDEEYPRLYRRFASLVRASASDVDLAPLQLVADAFLLGERVEVPPFSF